jgi:hypothetical protein
MHIGISMDLKRRNFWTLSGDVDGSNRYGYITSSFDIGENINMGNRMT